MSFSQKAVELFNEGYSCSETMVRAAHSTGLIQDSADVELMTRMASSFSAAMGGSGCLCGAVVGVQMVSGAVFGRNSNQESAASIREISKEIFQGFKAVRKKSCCKGLTSGYEFSSPERRENCAGIVKDAAEVFETIYTAKK